MINLNCKSYFSKHCNVYSKNIHVTLGFVLLLFHVAFGYATGQSEHELKQLVVDKYRENVESIVCGNIQWKQQQIRNGFGGIKTEEPLLSEYKMVWLNDKIYTHAKTQTVLVDKSGQFDSIKEQVVTSSYNGKDFRIKLGGSNEIVLEKNKRLDNFENWLCISGMAGKREQGKEIEGYEKVLIEYYGAPSKWEMVEYEGKPVIQRSYRETIELYDPNKGFGRILYKSQTAHNVIDYKQLPCGAWFPFKVEKKSYDRESGELTLHDYYEVDMSNSSVNVMSDINEQLFEIPIESGMEVKDVRLGTKLIYNKNEAPLPSEEVFGVTTEFLNRAESESDIGTSGNLPKGSSDNSSSKKIKVTDKPFEPRILEQTNNNYLSIIFLIVVLVILIALLFFFYQRGKGKDAKNNSKGR